MRQDRLRPLDRLDGVETKLGGRIGRMQALSQERLWGSEFDEKFLIADLDFNQERWFTNYSGDISGRFLECMALSGKEKANTHRALSYLLENIPRNQREDGHFGIEMDFAGPIDSDQPVPRVMPILWGNARMLPALVEAWLTFGDKALLESAKKLGDFYLASEGALSNPNRIEEYRASGTYAPGYATCYFPAMEGLMRLYWVTGEEKYFGLAKRMAMFRKEHKFDALPIEHSHGFLCSVYGLLLLAWADSEGEWLEMARTDWENLVEGGYVLPSGGLLEKAVHGYALDEGCSQADWLRVNLLFYCLTKQDRYLDMAERVLYNQMRINQCEAGGFGHRRVLYDSYGVVGYGKYHAEAVWCCAFHGAAALLNLKSCVLLEESGQGALRIPLLLDFAAKNSRAEVVLEECGFHSGASAAGSRKWRLSVRARGEEPVTIRLRVPVWARDFQVSGAGGETFYAQGGWVTLEAAGEATEYTCSADCPVYVENRHFGRKLSPEDGYSFLLRQGPDLLAAQGKGAEPAAVIDGPDDGMEAVYVFRADAVKAEPVAF